MIILFFRVASRFFCSHQIDQCCGAVHGWFVGAVITIVIMIHGKVTLELCIFIRLIQCDTDKIIVDTSVNGAVDEAAIDRVIF